MSSILCPSIPKVSFVKHVMESISTLKYLPKRLVLIIYGSCFSLFVFCVFYTYSATHTRSIRPLPENSQFENTEKVYASEDASSHVHDGGDQGIDERKILRTFQKFSDDNSHIIRDSATSDRLPLYASTPEVESRYHPNSTFPITHSEKQIYTVSNPPQSKIANHPFTEQHPSHQKLTVADSNSIAETKSGTTCIVGKPKLILLWTTFFGIWNYLTDSSFSHCKDCPNCVVTTNRSLLLQSDAVIFHARDMYMTDIPSKRLPHQIWIFYCLESPSYSDFPGFEFMHNMFNWTMTYRLDSDIISDYGTIEKVYPKKSLNKSALKEIWSKKSRSVVWMSSHCPTHGGRDDYAQELKKYIDVDEFGFCGQQVCPKDSTKKCMEQFATTYKFFLAFENSICKDYITEKFFRTLSYDIIPVVFGGAAYGKVAPPGSYIDALSFKSPKHLAYFLTRVEKDFNLYLTYFEWRRDFTVQLNSNRNCILCSSLHRKHLESKSYEDMKQWWVFDGQCTVWKPT